MEFDVAIIGAGLGGLTAGAKLAKEWFRVLLIEQHNIPGGCATLFKRKNVRFEVSLHAVDGMDEEDYKLKIFRDLDVLDAVKFFPLDEFYKVKSNSQNIDMILPNSGVELKKMLLGEFPNEVAGINKFFDVIAGLRRDINRFIPATYQNRFSFYSKLATVPFTFPYIFRHINATLGGFLDSIIQDDRLKIILSANLAYYHDDPYSMSLPWFGTAQGSFFKGSHYIKGGSQELSNYLAEYITKRSGKVMYNQLATKIITKNGQAVGIEFCSKLKPNEKTSVPVKWVISNSAIPYVAQNLLDPEDSKKLQKKIQKFTPGLSFCSLFLGYTGELKNSAYSTILLNEKISSLKDIATDSQYDFSKRTMLFVDYGQIDSGMGGAQTKSATACCVEYMKSWKDLDESAYLAKKKEGLAQMLVRLDQEYPGFSSQVSISEFSTPRTIERYTLNTEGSVYGFAQTPTQANLARLPLQNPIKNLFFASAWGFPGGGQSAAIEAGYTSAQNIMRLSK